MHIYDTTLILIGFQNDYFASDGILRSVIEESDKVTHTVANTTALLKRLQAAGTLPPVVATPIVFTADYRELDDTPVGILQQIKTVGAFNAGHKGSDTIDEIKQFGDRIHYLPGKQGLNAFSNTDLYPFLIGACTTHVVLAGAVTSICIDSTGREAFERGFKVHILSDCTSARTTLEHEFYCRHIFPLYAEVLTYNEFLTQLDL